MSIANRPHRAFLATAAVLFALPFAVRGEETCFECHSDVDLVGDERLAVPAAEWEATVHGGAGIACLDCHRGKTEYPHRVDTPALACRDCHDAAEILAESAHAPDGPGAPRPACADCHGAVHALTPASEPSSAMHETRQPATCGACHADPRLAESAGIRLVQPIAAYTASVHARGVARGEHAATCSSCHGAHDILAGVDERSRVHHANVPKTCGRCHVEITATYNASVHGIAAAKGIRSSPVCTDCHGEHDILGPADEGSPVYASNVPRMTCGRCHGDLRVTKKFGMKADAVAAFEDSFHGLASRSGSVTVANCASCHGVHDILPSSDPESHIHPDRLAATCGACHPGAGASFAIGEVHVLPEDRESAHPAVYWVRLAYLWLIWLTIGGMAAHNLLDLRRKTLSPVARPVTPMAERRLRMVFGFRVAHAALLTSFFALVWSGFALKYPDAFWAQPLLAWEDRLDFRGTLHRGAALVMLAAFAFHALHLLLDRRARACIRAMLPNRHDLAELGEKLCWLVGRRAEMPKAPPLGYAEKAEYLALVWGTVVMAISGFVLWFENWSLAHLPKWASDVATVVHFYEAILASLAIVVWHFYFVIFDPLVYPMDTAWLTGREAPGRSLERTAALVAPPSQRATEPPPERPNGDPAR